MPNVLFAQLGYYVVNFILKIALNPEIIEPFKEIEPAHKCFAPHTIVFQKLWVVWIEIISQLAHG
jgi:hypothetical protein